MNTTVKQGCILSALLFLKMIDAAIYEKTRYKVKEICWNITQMLEDIEYADYVE